MRLKRGGRQGSTRWRSTPRRPRPPGSRSEHCPAGHESAATDYCDVCGDRDGSRRDVLHPAGGGTGRAPRPASTNCPNCPAANPGRAVLRELRLRLHDRVAAASGDPPATTAAPPAVVADPAPPLARLGRPRSGSTPTGTPSRSPRTRCPRSASRAWYRCGNVGAGRPGSRSRGIHRHRPVHRLRRLAPARPAEDQRRALVGRGPRLLQRHLRRRHRGRAPQDPGPGRPKKEIPPDGRVYLGAWTRITVRKAAPGEVG